MIREFTKENLKIKVFDSRLQMGQDGAEKAAARIRKLLDEKRTVNILFAAAPSQNELLDSLARQPDIEWERINAFHMDEYIGLPDGDPRTFGEYLKKRIFSKVPFGAIYYINGISGDQPAVCRKYGELLDSHPLDFGFLGIGENGHIAFNDPPVADFDDPEKVKIVELDAKCRQQQVNDGCFATLEEVPKEAITLTLPALRRIPSIFCTAPTFNKAQAVHDMVYGPVSTSCPASILRLHPDTTVYLDEASASML